jgi:ABC-type phosphate/phosphonate transport system ATPase subunit
MLIKKDKTNNILFSLSLFEISQTDILSKKDFRKNVIFIFRKFDFVLHSKVVKNVAIT